MNQVLKVLLERRSCRSYDREKAIKEDDLFQILKAAAYAPSAMNTQAWHFTAVTHAEKLEKLNRAVYEQMDEATRTRISGRAADGTFHFFYHAPALIIVSCNPDASPYPEADCACALQNLFLAATSLGLGSCWINQLTHNSFEPIVRAVLDELGVPPQNKVYGCAALGYAAAASPMKDRAPHTVNWVK